MENGIKVTRIFNSWDGLFSTTKGIEGIDVVTGEQVKIMVGEKAYKDNIVKITYTDIKNAEKTTTIRTAANDK